jgi:diacylglycerol kinase family enzyme
VAGALASSFDVSQVVTKAPGHAVEVAYEAAGNRVDVVAVLGGDGTVNEVANGLALSPVPMGIIPGGGADVFARSLGIPKDTTLATDLFLHSARDVPRRVSLGRVRFEPHDADDGRYFVANCGVGFDAAIVRSVEQNQRTKRRFGDWYFVWTGLRQFFAGFDRREPHLEIWWGEGGATGGHDDELFLAIVQNTSPYTYLGNRAIRLCPDATLDGGLDCFAVKTMRTRTILPILLSAFGRARGVSRSEVAYIQDQRRIRIRSDQPMPAQVDGEFIGERNDLVVESVPDALSLFC